MFRIISMFLLCPFAVALAQGEGKVLAAPDGEDNADLRDTAMPELGDGEVAKILRRYYEKGLGGAENWDKVVSLSGIGTWKTKSDERELKIYRKKPNFLKMILFDRPSGSVVTLAYDGKQAWKKVGRRAKPVPMEESEARHFIHKAVFGNYLLYPFAEGKRIQLIDTIPLDGRICHHLRVELDTDYQVDYYIDIRSYREAKAVHTDLHSGAENSVRYQKYTLESGLPVARKIVNWEEGQWASRMLLNEVKVNSGVMPWMFHMPK